VKLIHDLADSLPELVIRSLSRQIIADDDIAPGLNVGPNCERQYSLNAAPFMAWFRHQGAVSWFARKPAMKVSVCQWPAGAASLPSAAERTAIAADHITRGAGFVEKNQLRQLTAFLPGLPVLSGHRDVFASLFTGEYSFL
jgi:hypothetical protein